VLGIAEISTTESFSDAGGHSLLAVHLFSLITNEFNIDLPLSTLIKAPTIQQLAEEVQVATRIILNNNVKGVKNGADDSWSSLVAIKSSGENRPFFCMHAVGGNVLNYQAFIPYIVSEQPLYGLQSRGLDGVSRPRGSIEEMATSYIQEIKALQKTGPYYLGGASMGGDIALEVAQQLKRHGDEVACLIMFDTFGPALTNDLVNNNLSLLKSLKSSFFYKIKSHSFINVIKILVSKIYYVLIRRAREGICNIYQYLDVPIPHKWRYWYVEQANLRSVAKYKPKKYQGKLILFSDSREKDGVDLTKGWAPIFSEEIEVIEVKAPHYEFIEEPKVGRELAKVLARFNSKGS
jgi:thioesterase domain-containing protein/acyl carrier protein